MTVPVPVTRNRQTVLLKVRAWPYPAQLLAPPAVQEMQVIRYQFKTGTDGHEIVITSASRFLGLFVYYNLLCMDY